MCLLCYDIIISRRRLFLSIIVFILYKIQRIEQSAIDKAPVNEYNKKVLFERDLSSAGRASALQAEGHRFEPYRSHFTEK